MDNLDEKHLDMLRNHLSVYEVDGIQCQLTFEKKTVTLEVDPWTSLCSDRSSLLVYRQQFVCVGTREEQSVVVFPETDP